jgi:hypothetical protein
MSAAPPSVMPILATPFSVVPLPAVAALNAALASLFVERAALPGAAAATAGPLCFQSRDDLLDWTEAPVRTAVGEILQGVRSVVAAVNDFAAGQLETFGVQARAWFTIVRPDGAVPARIHPLTSWCAVYCVAAPEPSPTRYDSGVLRLYESRLGTMFSDISNAAMHMPFTPAHASWSPVPGQLAVFPGSVMHEVALLRSTLPLILLTARARFVAPGQQAGSAW